MAAPVKKKTSMGMEENIAGLLSYLAWAITGLIFYFGEKENKFVRFHALQSIAFTIVVIAVEIIMWIINMLLWAVGLWMVIPILSLIVWLAIIVLWIFLMVKAYQGATFKLPLIGDFCEKQVK
jgi:uncharacterized membrane protein